MHKILIVDDEKNMIWALNNALVSQEYSIISATTGKEAFEKVSEEELSLILLDIKLPDIDGVSVLKKIRETDINIPVIMMTAHGTVDTAIQAMKLGATDYISKPFDLEEMRVLVSKAISIGEMAHQINFLKNELKGNLNETIIGESPKMKAVLDVAEQVAKSDATVLISGESGTGKEVISDYIYKMSNRSNNAFIKVNCGALPEGLLESELFGHEKGSFTGAISRKIGRFERANKGTIFLDEIGEIPLSTQVKLLRVLQQKEIERVGGTETIKIDVRIIAATNRNLKEMVEEGTFREDLYYRLNVIPIFMPPLRERKEDIPLLIRYFITRFSIKMHKAPLSVNNDAMEVLIKHYWRGNIRELENFVERMIILTQDSKITLQNLPSEIKAFKENGTKYVVPEEGINLELVEKDFIEQALKLANSNQTKAAELLGITRHTLLYRIEKYDIKL